MEDVYKSPNSDLAKQVDDKEYQPKVFSMSGRIGRLRFLAYSMLFSLFSYIATVALAIIVGLILPNSQDSVSNIDRIAVIVSGVSALVFSVIFMAVYFVLSKRRLNDLNKTGWLSLLGLIPIINILFSLYLLFWPGTDSSNDYGAKPAKNSILVILGGVLMPVLFVGIMAALMNPLIRVT